MNILGLFTKHKKIFITGTDTEVGKTYCASLIIKELLNNGLDVFPFKPISAGTTFYFGSLDAMSEITPKSHMTQSHYLNRTDGHNIVKANEDAVSLFNAVQHCYSLDQINPIVFQQPIAPHIAAKIENETLDFKRLDFEFNKVKALGEAQIIEGAGGWHLPLNDTELLSGWVEQQQLPVILVVGIKLGCLNHTLLTAQAIEKSGCELIGWIANFIEGDNEIAKENVKFLQQKLTAPLLTKIQKGQQSLVRVLS